MNQDLIKAHKHSSDHRKELQDSKVIGCFYCLRLIKFSQIREWCDKGQTGICPNCGIDSLISDASGFKITKKFLKDMNRHWFSIVKVK